MIRKELHSPVITGNIIFLYLKQILVVPLVLRMRNICVACDTLPDTWIIR